MANRISRAFYGAPPPPLIGTNPQVMERGTRFEALAPGAGLWFYAV